MSTLARCGTRSAYQRHVRKQEPIDEACRIANSKADRRLRETGSTKEAPEQADETPRVSLDGDARRAALAVTSRAADAADARQLLEIIGVLPAVTG